MGKSQYSPFLERVRYSMILKNRQSGIKGKKERKKAKREKINDPSLLNHIFLLLLQKCKTVLEDVIMQKIWGGREEELFIPYYMHCFKMLIVG